LLGSSELFFFKKLSGLGLIEEGKCGVHKKLIKYSTQNLSVGYEIC
jgi:hypothetical protein